MSWPGLAAAEKDSTTKQAYGRDCFAWLVPCLPSVGRGYLGERLRHTMWKEAVSFEYLLFDSRAERDRTLTVRYQMLGKAEHASITVERNWSGEKQQLAGMLQHQTDSQTGFAEVALAMS